MVFESHHSVFDIATADYLLNASPCPDKQSSYQPRLTHALPIGIGNACGSVLASAWPPTRLATWWQSDG